MLVLRAFFNSASPAFGVGVGNGWVGGEYDYIKLPSALSYPRWRLVDFFFFLIEVFSDCGVPHVRTYYY